MDVEGQSNIWSYFQNEQQEAFSGNRARLTALLRVVVQAMHGRDGQVLNIGPGDGYFEELARVSGLGTTTLDLSPDTINRMRDAGFDAHAGSMTSMPFADNRFDVVVASEVIEHLDEAERQSAYAEIARVLAAGGAFVGTVPDNEDLQSNVVICPCCGDVFHRWGHKQSFTLASLHTELSQSFASVSVHRRTFVQFRGRGVSGMVKASARCLLGLLGQPMASSNLLFVARIGR